MKEKFFADCMLGRLAKWLRILGYDTVHQRSSGKRMPLSRQSLEDRRLLTRRCDLLREFPECVFIHSDHVGEQLRQLVEEGLINSNPELSLHRCSSCNTELDEAEAGEAVVHVPEYVFFCKTNEFKWCKSCGRYYWRGTHYDRMAAQLKVWGV